MLPPAELARQSIIRSRAAHDSEEWVRWHLWQLDDATVRELYQAFVDVYGQLSGKLVRLFMANSDDAWKLSDIGARERTEALLSQINDSIVALLAQAQDVVFNAAFRAYQAGAYGRAWVLDQALRGGLSDLPLLPTEAIRAAILAPYEGSTFLDRFANARAEFEQAIRREVVKSQIAGDSIAQATKRLRDALGVKRGDPKALFARVEMIARTEVLRSSNAGAMATYEQNQDVLAGWEWLASKDERVCPICGALDGQVFQFGAPQSPPPVHPNCRCSEIPVLKDQALQDEIAGKRETYSEWAARRGVSIVNDGGVLKFRGQGA